MKIIQTIVNYIDFQSRIIEIDMDWKDFKEYLFSHIYDGIHDDEIGVKRSYPIGKGLLINNVQWYEVNQDDKYHLDITYTPHHKKYNGNDERVCFLMMEENDEV